jgi:prolipoprotein diacylglyceryltransferase
MAAAGLAVGAVVGRIGDLAIVEHLGSQTNFFLGYTLKPGYNVSPQHNVLQRLCDSEGICGPYHPTALYDMIGAAVLLGLLFYLHRSWTGRRYGQMFAVWMIWYGFQRFLIDFTRLDAARDGTVSDSVMGPLTGSQWGGLAAAALGLIVFVIASNRNEIVSAAADREYGAQLPMESVDTNSA